MFNLLSHKPETAFGQVERRSLRSVLKDTKGISVSMPDLLPAVGISATIVALLVGSVGAGFVFGQNATAQGALSSVQTAQAQVKAETGSYGALSALTSGTAGSVATVSNPPATLAVTSSKNAFCAVVKSDSMIAGATYWVSAKTGKITDKMPTAAEAGIACPAAPA